MGLQKRWLIGMTHDKWQKGSRQKAKRE